MIGPPAHSTRRHAVMFGLALALSCPLAAGANPFEMFGAGARSQGMGGASSAVVDDASAVFHNPALLPFGEPHISLAMNGVFDRTSVLLMPRPTGYDATGYDTRVNPRSDTEGGSVYGAVDIGFSLEPFGDDFAIGGLARLPLNGFANIDSSFPDEREQYHSNQLHFPIIDRSRTELLGMGVAYRWRPWLSMGFGLLVMPAASSANAIYTPNAADPGSVELNLKVEQGLEEAVVAGLLIEPLDWLRIGLVFQDELYLSLAGQNAVIVEGVDNGQPVDQVFEIIYGYAPTRLVGSVALVSDGGWTLTGEGTWLAWSRYQDDHSASPTVPFEDTLNLRLGVELPSIAESTVRFGFGWLPTPVPAQTGRTNYVDNDRFVLALGGSRAFEIWSQSFRLDLSVQVHALRSTDTFKDAVPGGHPDCAEGVTVICDEVPDRETDSPTVNARDTVGLQTGNPGFPGFSSGGYLVVAGMDVQWRF